MGVYLGKEVFKLGFGLMRLPKLKDGSIDIEQTAEMANRFPGRRAIILSGSGI